MNRGGCYEILSACFEVSIKKKSENISFAFRIGSGKYHDFEHQHDTYYAHGTFNSAKAELERLALAS